ncbi:MAG TPA: hypothetical protein VLE03_02930 [Nitrospiraceae bacterium]|nr:hypothetical protein [Nitrospiraceae bacterium]
MRVQPLEALPQKPAAGLPQEEKPEAVPVPEIPQERPQVKHEERPEPKALNRMVNRLLNILTADNGTNRTAVVGRAQFLTEYRERRDSSVQLSNTARVDIPLAANLLWRTDADLTLYDPRTAGNSPSFATGDVSTRLGTKIYEEPAFTTFIEAQVVFPTATNDNLGRGKYQLVPAVFFSIPIQKLDMAVFPGIQQDVSVGGDPSRKGVNFTKLNLEMTKPWANSLWWTTFEPVLYIDWTQKAKTAFDLEFEVGRRLGDHWRAWFRPAVGLWGTGVPGSYDWYAQIGIRYMF